MSLLQQQQACFESIKTLCTNYKKDGPSRKTVNYLNDKLNCLETQWQDFRRRHAILLEELEDKEINYFTEEIYEKTEKMYETFKADIREKLRILEINGDIKFDFRDLLNETGDDYIKLMLKKQGANFKAIDRAMSKIDPKLIREKWELEDNLSILKAKWEVIDKLHWELEGLLESDDSYYDMFLSIESKYDELRRKLNSKIWSTTHYQQAAPKIEVPEFSGNYSQWISFKDLFLETIDSNPTINRAQKMQHLKTRLRGEAAKLVQHLNISGDNYSSCWEILHQRYDNRRMQFSSYMNTMLNLPQVHQPDAFNLKRLHDVMNECLNGLSNIGVDTSSWGPIIVHLMLQKLDATTYNEYMKEQQDHRDLPNLKDFLGFLENKFLAYETMKNNKKEVAHSTPSKQPQSFNKNAPAAAKKHNFEYKKTYHSRANYGKCPLCSENHVLMQCSKFIELNSSQRNMTASKLRVCKNCLFSHGNNECASTKLCKECNMKHHTLLHVSKKTAGNEDGNSTDRPSTSSQPPSSNHLSTNEIEILLTTVKLQVKSNDGTYVTLRALLDQGSQVNLIAENAAQLLRLPRKKLNATISGVGSVSGDCKGSLQLSCKSIYSDYKFETQVLILKNLTHNLPNSSFAKKDWPHLENLKLADPDFNVSRPIDLLLGADIYSTILMDGVLKGQQQSPVAQQTHLGWILCGKLKTFNCLATLIDLTEITKFWETEDIAQDDTKSKDDQCEENYVKTVQRGSDGKYIVKMPLTADYREKLGKSKAIATSQFLQLEKRLEKKEKLAQMNGDFIQEYAELQHMKPASPISTYVPECFLPHHGVLREQSTTTKLRVVFNASQKTTTGFSLNSVLEKGPNLQKDIQALILKWRSYKYAFTADIEKMYRCIWVSEDQQPLQKIIWRDAPNSKLQEFELCTVTYGTKCAPWLAMRTLKQLALDDGHKYPEAANILQNEFYVDDLISGHNSIEEAKKLQQSLISLLKGAGMNLRKWSTNHPALIKNLTEEQISTKSLFDFKTEDSTQTLGLGWNPKTDTFTFNWNLEEKSKSRMTKRVLLCEISKLYDPLGWWSPITVYAKLLFQKVWLSKLAWDEDLPSDILNEWLKLKAELPYVQNLKLNRWIGGSQQIELLGFCDASEKAYSCVIYSRVTNERGEPVNTLLVAKTRVAPLAQKTTLPRLELCGALLLSRLIKKTSEALTGCNITVRAWCDSQVVLAWLQGDTSRWDKYVANRVAQIKLVIPAENWEYIRSEQNPADCASRGMLPAKLLNFKLWWQGPDFITTTVEPMQSSAHSFETNMERANPTVATLTAKREEHFIHELLNKCSSYSHVNRVVAWIRRFSANARDKTKSETNYLTASELTAANDEIIKYVQRTEFETEYKCLSNKESVPIKSAIYKLNPYLDDKKIIRVGGRLDNSNLPFEMKKPAILPRTGRLTELLIENAHSTTLHGGARLTLSYIRQRYWIVGGNRAVKTQLRRCVRCHRYQPNKNHQLMGDLPYHRTTPLRPFTHTGVDFTGFVEIKLNKGRGVKTSKGYIAIFVCMATKAVHIELVSDLSTDNFIAAFQRMCARRGTPKHVYSDCGTNFIGAARMLRSEFELFQQELSPDFFTEIGKLEVEWHFNAPAWPSAGGLWEAAVKSMKHHLRRVLGDQKLTYEEFTTLLTKIEACMNSRPLCPLTEDPEEFYSYLTPGHFLTGSPTMSPPISDYSDVNQVDLRRRWQLTEHMLQQFWKSWSNEYLTQLQSRCKWNKPMKNLKEDDIVLVKDSNLSPGKWAMGRVIELHPGSDGYVRVATLKTQSGVIKRPIVKLSPLPTKDDQQPKKDETKKPKKGNNTRFVTTMFTILITMFTLFSGSYGSGVTSNAQITNFEPERPIYYDTLGNIQVIHDEWTLLMYYNLTNYWDGVRRMEAYLESISNLCKQTDPHYCQTTLEQLYHEIDLLKYYNSILLAPHKHLSSRKKRGLIDGVGSIANSLFGILDQRFAEKYQDDIQTIQSNENYLLELIKNQTSVVELENSVLKKNEDNIKKQFGLIDDFMMQTNANLENIKSEMEIVMATSYFNSASLAAYLLISNLKTVQEMLFNTLTDVYKGHIDVHLLTPTKLVDEMSEIAGRLPRTLSLPVRDIREDIKDLYKLLYVRARVTSTYFLFEIHIPLISDEDFTLYRAIPLPMKTSTGTVTVRLTSPFIAVNFRKNSYVSLTENDMKMCTQLQPNNLVCNKNLPIYNLQNNNAPCEAKLLGHRATSPCDVMTASCKDTWIELHAANTWLAICCETCTLRTICEDHITSRSMTTGVISLSPGCMLQSKDLTIYSHNQYSSNLKMNYHLEVPTLNSTVNSIVNISYHNSQHLLSLPNDSRVEEIDKRLASLKAHENKLPATISAHDVHQYIICYVLVGVTAIAAMWWVLKKLKSSCCSNRKSEPTPHQQSEEIEMHTIRRGKAAENIAFNFD